MNVKAIFGREREASPRIMPPQARRAWSERAAEVEGYVENLEADVVRLQQESQSWERAASLAEGERDRFHTELMEQREQARRELAEEKAERQRLEGLVVALDAEFVLLANAIVASMEKIRGGAARYAPKPEMMRNLAREIETPVVDEQTISPEKVPDFLANGPAVAS